MWSVLPTPVLFILCGVSPSYFTFHLLPPVEYIPISPHSLTPQTPFRVCLRMSLEILSRSRSASLRACKQVLGEHCPAWQQVICPPQRLAALNVLVFAFLTGAMDLITVGVGLHRPVSLLSFLFYQHFALPLVQLSVSVPSFLLTYRRSLCMSRTSPNLSLVY